MNTKLWKFVSEVFACVVAALIGFLTFLLPFTGVVFCIRYLIGG